MSRYLVTGCSGFVGRKFIEYLNDCPGRSEVAGVDIAEPKFDPREYQNLDFRFKLVDMRDRERLCKVIYDFAPEYILHLASYSSVSGSWKSPGASFQNNLNIFLNLVECVRSVKQNCRLISVGSSEEYGRIKLEDLPLKEDLELHPTSPFGIARFSQEMVAKLYEEVHGLDIIMTRSFNHLGAGMNSEHAVASFASQLVKIKNSRSSELLVTGDIDIVRDFIDVRDVVRAYHMLFMRGRKGQVYNVCSGYGISLHNTITLMCNMLDMAISMKTDRKLIRPRDHRVIIGCNDKIRNEINWSREIPLETSLADLLTYYAENTSTTNAAKAGVARK